MGLIERLLGPSIEKLAARGDRGGLLRILGTGERAEQRVAAARALAGLGLEPETMRALVASLADPADTVVGTVEEILREAGAAAADELAGKLGTAAGERALALLVELGDVGLDRLRAAAVDGEDDARRRALGALGESVGDASEVDETSFRTFLAALGDRLPECRTEAARVLGVIADPRASRALAAQLKDRNDEVSTACVRALARIGGAAVPELAAAVGDRNPNARRLAAALLGEICAADTPMELRRIAVDALLAAAESGPPELRQAAAVALTRIPAGDLALALVAELEDPETGDREERAEQLEAMARHASLNEADRQAVEDALGDHGRGLG